VPGSPRKTVLTILALCTGQTVGYDLLIKLVWEARTPATAVNSLQSHISYLRSILGSSTAITAQASGYRLELGPEATDVLQAEQLIVKAAPPEEAHS
jgi:DNA-binding SARP family transcriptional activator